MVNNNQICYENEYWRLIFGIVPELFGHIYTKGTVRFV